MDAIHSKLTWVKGRCYRVSEIDKIYLANSGNIDDHPEAAVVPRTTSCSSHSDEPCEVEFDIDITENGQYSTFFEIPNAIRGIVIGSKGATKKRIENETKTSIRFPMQGYEGDIIIKGSSRNAVAAARRRMEAMAESARLRHEPTHFISLPLNDPKIIEAFGKFKENVLETCEKEKGVTLQVFQKAEKLHLTIGTLVLLSAREREAASHLLGDCENRIVKPLLKSRPLHIKMKGIEYMNDDPAEVNVLYAKVFSLDKIERVLQDLSNEVMKEFVNAGMMKKEYESIKLHATVMNSVFNRGQSKDQVSGKRRETFDARMILKHFSNFEFGSCCIPTIHLSQRHTEGKDGYYCPTAVLQLPA